MEVIPAVNPELANVEPFKTVLSGNREAIAKLSVDDLLKIATEALTGMSVDEFNTEVKNWMAAAKDPRWKKPYTELTYLPMQEVLGWHLKRADVQSFSSFNPWGRQNRRQDCPYSESGRPSPTGDKVRNS